jgi:hypothetical protein
MLAGPAGQSGMNSCPLPNGCAREIKSNIVLYSKTFHGRQPNHRRYRMSGTRHGFVNIGDSLTKVNL